MVSRGGGRQWFSHPGRRYASGCHPGAPDIVPPPRPLRARSRTARIRGSPRPEPGQDGVASQGLGLVQQDAQHQLPKGLAPPALGHRNGAYAGGRPLGEDAACGDGALFIPYENMGADLVIPVKGLGPPASPAPPHRPDAAGPRRPGCRRIPICFETWPFLLRGLGQTGPGWFRISYRIWGIL